MINSLSRLVEKILTRQVFSDDPLVLIDIGSAGPSFRPWRAIASRSVFVGFDISETDSVPSGKFRRELIVSKIVTTASTPTQAFYITSSPYCSSTLEPSQTELERWHFRDLFKVERVETASAITVGEALAANDIDYIDWLKLDTQGTDLRIFRSLSENLRNGLAAVDLEPGILDAYRGEDKASNVFGEFDVSDFWLARMRVGKAVRCDEETELLLDFATRKLTSRFATKSPGWLELTYLRKAESFISERRSLTQWLFAYLLKQYAECIAIATIAFAATGDDFFKFLQSQAKARLRMQVITVGIL